VIVYANNGLGILTDWRFTIIKLKGKIFPVHAVKVDRGRSIVHLLLHLRKRWIGWSFSRSSHFVPGEIHGTH